ncbi:MAG TPA: sugar phosphate nucleotidyltransferase [Anaerolineales bacterium]|nr:sugar phosphate nucleotidyltransferase [Anaerolineales bacterium]
MHIPRAVITAAGRNQRALPLQTLVDRDGQTKSVLAILIAEAVSAGVDEVAVVIAPGDEDRFAEAAGLAAARLTFIPQSEPLGYAHALWSARAFVGQEAFLHLVSDHLWVSTIEPGCARQLVELAAVEGCAVSAVQATREHLLPSYGAVGGRRVPGRQDLYVVETVLEKPTPTEAELRLHVPGQRAGHYLCFFGMHILTPAVLPVLADLLADPPVGRSASLSDALARLAARERVLAFEAPARRYDLGDPYGLLTAQLALALSGPDREVVLSRLLELLAGRDLDLARRAG